MRGKTLCFLHIVQHKNGTQRVPGGIPTRSVGNDQSGAVERKWSAGRPLSRAGSLLQWNDARLQEIGRLSGRLRGQASLLQWNDARLQEIGRLAGRLRGQASLLQWNDARLQVIGRLAGRLRWQASLLQWNDARLQVIGRLLGRLRGQASLLQWNDARLQEIGRLAGRLRGQASLLQWNDARPQEIGRLAGRLRGQASLLQWNDARPQEIGRLAGRLRGQASLLQGVRCTRFAFHHSLGRALARLLLILICPPLREAEWRRSSGGGRVAPCGEAAHIERRSKRSRPEAMPPDECRSEGTPSPGEGPDAGAKRFGSFWAFAKGTRCKSETANSRYRRNGYVRHQQQHGRLPGRQAQTDSAVS